MRRIIPGVNNFKTIPSRILMGLICLSMIGGLSVVTALGDEHRGRGPGDRGRGHDHIERVSPNRYYYEHGRRVYRPYGYGYGYAAPLYAPPPVIYAPPPPPPGISIFFPPIVIR